MSCVCLKEKKYGLNGILHTDHLKQSQEKTKSSVQHFIILGVFADLQELREKVSDASKGKNNKVF